MVHHHEQAHSDCGCHSCSGDSCGCHSQHHHQGKGQWMELALGVGFYLLAFALGAVQLQMAKIAFFVLSYLVLGRQVLKQAGLGLLKGRVLDENFLMRLATLGAFAIGEFPEAVGVMLFYRIGEAFEHQAVERSRRQIRNTVDMRPETVQKITGEQVATIPAGKARVGDLLLVRPGDRIPLDGIAMQGESHVDTAPITGEPMPVAVQKGSKLVSGCVNLEGQLVMQVQKPLGESMVSRILESVENAAAGKPKMDRFITRFAKVYTPAVVLSAVLVAVVPSLITGNWREWTYTALSFLVMSCPCALVLSVPLAFFAGIGAGGKAGILFKSGLTMEALPDIRVVALDKTGTLTQGQFCVQEIVGGERVLTLCAGCEQGSTHPIGRSILKAAEGQKLPIPEKVKELAGLGIQATVNGKEILCGNEKMMARFGIAVSGQQGAGTRVFVAEEGKLLGWLRIGDTLRPDAEQGIKELKKRGIRTVLLTGDSHEAAQEIGKRLQVDGVYAQLLPEEKLEVLQKLRQQYGKVMFVGDGINDAPVLSGADVGAAMGSGADAAIEAADVVYMRPQIRAIADSMDIAARSGRIAKRNVVIALGVKLAVMLLGIFGYASMWAAVLADSGVAVLCVALSVAPLYRKKEGKK